METCVNCACEFSDPYQNSEDLKEFSVYEPLSTIYKLNYLSAFTNSSESESTACDNDNTKVWKLCENCLGLFTNLLGFYHDFNQLQSLESKLAIEIQKLDYFVQSQQQQQQQKQNPIIKEEKKKDYASQYQDPIVILHRLENVPEAQKYLPNLNFTKNGKKSQNNSNIKRVGPSFGFSKPKVNNTHHNININHGDSNANENENSGDINDNMDNFYEEGGFFIPILQDQQQQQQEKTKRTRKIAVDDLDDDDYCPKPKKQKKGKITKPIKKDKPPKTFIIDTSTKTINERRRKTVAPSEEPDPKKRSNLRKKFIRDKLLNYKQRKTKAPSPCWECQMDFATKEECYEHTMKEHFQPGDHVCEDCSKIYQTAHLLKVHQEDICPSYKPGELLPGWNCEECEKKGKTITFSVRKYHSQHLRQVHGKGVMKCPIPGCKFITNARSKLQRHSAGQHPAEPDLIKVEDRTCQLCPKAKIYKTKALLMQHHTNHHTVEGIKKYQERLKLQNERNQEKNKDKLKL